MFDSFAYKYNNVEINYNPSLINDNKHPNDISNRRHLSQSLSPRKRSNILQIQKKEISNDVYS